MVIKGNAKVDLRQQAYELKKQVVSYYFHMVVGRPGLDQKAAIKRVQTKIPMSMLSRDGFMKKLEELRGMGLKKLYGFYQSKIKN